MAGLGTFLLEVGVDTNALQRGLSRAESTIESFGRKAESIGTKLSIAVSAPLALIAKNALSASGEFESLSMSFGVMLKSMDKGKTLMQDLQKYNLKTSFEFPEIAGAAKSMLAFGFAQQQVIPNLRMIGDLSSALGINIKDLADIYGKAKVQGTLFAEDINQLTGRGIPVIAEFAKQFGVSESAIKKMASEGKISFANLEQAFVSMTSKGGQFYNMTASQSTTLKGILSNFADSTTQSLTTLGDSIVKNLDLKKTIGQVSETIARITKSFSELSPEAQKAILAISGIAIVVPPLLALAGTVLPAISTGLGLLISPAGLAGAALVAAAVYAVSHWEQVEGVLFRVNKGFEDTLLKYSLLKANLKGAIDPAGAASDRANALARYSKNVGTDPSITNQIKSEYQNNKKFMYKKGDKPATGGTTSPLSLGGGTSQAALDAAKKLAEETKKVREDLLNDTTQAEIAIIQDSFAKQRAEANKAYLDDIKSKKDAIQGKKGLDSEYTNWFIARYEEMQSKLRAIQVEEFKTPALIKRTLVTDTQASLTGQLKSSGKVAMSENSLSQTMKDGAAKIDFQTEAQRLESYLKLAEGTVNNVNFTGYAKQAQAIIDANQLIKDSWEQVAIGSSQMLGEMIVNMATGVATMEDLAKGMLATLGDIFSQVLAQMAKMAIVEAGIGLATFNPALLFKGISLGIASGVVGGISKSFGQGRASNSSQQKTQGASVYSVVRGDSIYTAQNRYQTIKNF